MTEQKHPIIQLHEQVIDGIEYYILWDITNKCMLDQWMMENVLSMELMRHDLRIMGIDI